MSLAQTASPAASSPADAVQSLRTMPMFRSSTATRSQLMLAQNRAIALKARADTPADLHPRIDDVLALIRSRLPHARPI